MRPTAREVSFFGSPGACSCWRVCLGHAKATVSIFRGSGFGRLLPYIMEFSFRKKETIKHVLRHIALCADVSRVSKFGSTGFVAMAVLVSVSVSLYRKWHARLCAKKAR